MCLGNCFGLSSLSLLPSLLARSTPDKFIAVLMFPGRYRAAGRESRVCSGFVSCLQSSGGGCLSVRRLLCWSQHQERIWHGHHTSWCTYYVCSASCILFYFLNVLSWGSLQNGVMLPGKCWKSNARNVCENPFSFLSYIRKTEMPTTALKSQVVNVSCFDLGHCWKSVCICTHVMRWGVG